ncbi:hypothetical protein [Anaerorhabdus sp.]|uniref:hypothetical protein n=1 Tax=Anaerorhabdus sp. TaxID=1872524 RepID=UPI002FC78049
MSLFKNIIFSKRYIFVFTLLYTFALFSINSILIQETGNSIFFVRTAFENSFILSLDTRVFMITFGIIAPLLVCLACGNSYSDDKEANTLPMLYTKKNEIQYHINNLFSIFICTFILIFIPLFINFAISSIAFPTHMALDNMYANPAYILQNNSPNILETFKTYNPMLFLALSIFIISIILGVIAILNYTLSVLLDVNKYVINAIVFFTYIGFDMFLSTINKSEYSLFNYMDPNLTNAGFIYIVILLFIFFLISILILIIGIKRGR